MPKQPRDPPGCEVWPCGMEMPIIGWANPPKLRKTWQPHKHSFYFTWPRCCRGMRCWRGHGHPLHHLGTLSDFTGSESQNCIPGMEEGAEIPSTLCKVKWAPQPGGEVWALPPHRTGGHPESALCGQNFHQCLSSKKDFCLSAVEHRSL